MKFPCQQNRDGDEGRDRRCKGYLKEFATIERRNQFFISDHDLILREWDRPDIKVLMGDRLKGVGGRGLIQKQSFFPLPHKIRPIRNGGDGSGDRIGVESRNRV